MSVRTRTGHEVIRIDPVGDPEREAARLRAVQRYDILDTPPDGTFDRVARMAAALFDVPIATVTIVDHDRIWFKATHGIEVDEIGRDPGLCASAILQDDPYVVTDAVDDVRCFQNPLVHGELGVRFYAGAPIRTVDGHNLGTVNVISGQPREAAAAELEALEDLAAIVADELEVRLAARRTVEGEREQRDRAERLLDVLRRRLTPTLPGRLPGVDVATFYRPIATDAGLGGDVIDVVTLDADTTLLVIGDVCGKGPEAAALTGEIRSVVRAIARDGCGPAAVLRRLNDWLRADAFGHGVGLISDRFITLSATTLRRLDDGRLTATTAVGGHPLGLVRRADGTVERFGRTGQLLGVLDEVEVHQVTTELQPGDALLLLTDGAVEQRGVPISEGEAQLEALLAGAPTGDGAPAALAHVRAGLEAVHGELDDDIALVLAHATGGPSLDRRRRRRTT